MERTLHHQINFLPPARFPPPTILCGRAGRPPARAFSPFSIPGFNVAFFEGKAGWIVWFHRRLPISSRAAGTGRHPRALPILNAEGGAVISHHVRRDRANRLPLQGGAMFFPSTVKIMPMCQLPRCRVQVRAVTCAMRFRAPVFFFGWLVSFAPRCRHR